MSWSSYPSIYNLGHRAVKDLLNHPHIIEEKVDGSQFSFGLFHPDHCCAPGLPCIYQDTMADQNELRVRSKGAVMLVDAPEKMFNRAVETVRKLTDTLHPGWTYRAEYLAKPKHNTLAYDRVPEGNLIIFDISTGDQEWLSPADKQREAARLGLECVPLLLVDSRGGGTSLADLRLLIDTQVSILGGQKIEGIVVKPLGELYGPDHKTLMGKFVSEQFKEAHKEGWKVTSPNSGDILDRLSKQFSTQARWMKAAQHLREAGLLTDSPKDIPALMAEVQKDLGKECEDEITHILWKWAIPHINRAATRGLAEWWKERLLAQQFENQDTMSFDEAVALAAPVAPTPNI